METKSIDVPGISRDPSARMRFLMEFVGFTDADRLALLESVPVLGPVLPELLDALYNHLLAFDDTRRIFLGKRGEVDPNYIDLRKEHLTQWVLRTAGVSGEPGSLAAYLQETARRHTGVAGEPNRVVPPRYMVGLMGFVQSALWSALFAALILEDPPFETMGVRIRETVFHSQFLGMQPLAGSEKSVASTDPRHGTRTAR